MLYKVINNSKICKNGGYFVNSFTHKYLIICLLALDRGINGSNFYQSPRLKDFE
jgi:hypothetical protein